MSVKFKQQWLMNKIKPTQPDATYGPNSTWTDDSFQDLKRLCQGYADCPTVNEAQQQAIAVRTVVQYEGPSNEYARNIMDD